jgi:acyl-CoA thioesterase FadM
MARVELNLPEQFYFTTTLTVRFTDLNVGSHVGNDQMIALLSEARSRFLYHFEIEDWQEEGLNLLVTDLMATYKKSAFGHDILQFDVGIMDFNKYGGDIIFRVTRPATEDLIVLAKTGFVLIDTVTSKIAPLPEKFRYIFPDAF